MVRRVDESEGQENLFPAEDYQQGRPRRFKVLERPLWTENKAAFVGRYLYYFVFITKHGTYIDPFAGRQSETAHEGWAVENVLKNEPQRLRTFHLFERSLDKVADLEQLRRLFPDRDINVYHGDSNVELPRILPVGSIREAEASFCLLDQRTFECHWDTCRHVSQLKVGGRKVEQFYFLATGWLDRSIAGSTTKEGRERIDKWWGDSSWVSLRDLTGIERATLLAKRFREELGYAEATPWPIFDGRNHSRRVMYYMIHATDHAEAPALMRRAYDRAVDPLIEPADQLSMELAGFSLDG